MADDMYERFRRQQSEENEARLGAPSGPMVTLKAAQQTPVPAAASGVGLREALAEIKAAADELLLTLPGHWHDDATIRLTDAASDADAVLKAAEQDALYEDAPDPAIPGPGAATNALVDRFGDALKAKLRAAEDKYGWQNGWLEDDWCEDCQRDLARHVQKGDPLDVAAYAAFCWHHGWSTAIPGPGAGDAGATIAEIAAHHLSVDGFGEKVHPVLGRLLQDALNAAFAAGAAIRPAQPAATPGASEGLREASEGMVRAWEVLPEGYYSPSTIQSWMLKDLKPAIDRLRAAIASAPEQEIETRFETARADIAAILDTIAKEGLQEPRAPDVALDAILCSLRDQ